jgi:F-type H+-transporting ATPase subunit b
VVGATTTFTLLHAAVAFGADHGDAGHAAPSIGDLLLPAINFSLFLVIIVRYVVPAVRQYFRQRQTEITDAVEQARALLAAATEARAAAEARRTRLATESETIRKDLVTAAAAQAERTRARADDNGRRRLADATLVAEQERRRALQAIRDEVAALATERAERAIRSALSADDQRRFLRDFLADVPKQ